MIRPLPFVWPWAIAFWAVFVWAFLPEIGFMRRSRQAPPPATDAGSMRLVVHGISIAMLIGFAVAFFVTPLPSRAIAFWIGIALIVAGGLLRRHCFRVLGQYFTYAVQVGANQPVIDRGAYRWVRHPSYTAGTMLFIGLGLALGNWASIAILAVATIAVYGYRVMVEERALLETIGEPYRAYMAGRKRFIPFVF